MDRPPRSPEHLARRLAESARDRDEGYVQETTPGLVRSAPLSLCNRRLRMACNQWVALSRDHHESLRLLRRGVQQHQVEHVDAVEDVPHREPRDDLREFEEMVSALPQVREGKMWSPRGYDASTRCTLELARR